MKQRDDEPPLQGTCEFVARGKLLTAEELLHGSKQMETGGYQIRVVWCLLKNIPTLSLKYFTKLANHIRGRALSCSNGLC